jgi:hypothetical protein
MRFVVDKGLAGEDGGIRVSVARCTSTASYSEDGPSSQRGK